MSYEEALTKLKSGEYKAIMRPHWHWIALTYPGDAPVLVLEHNDGSVEAWDPAIADEDDCGDIAATDWMEAPKGQLE